MLLPYLVITFGIAWGLLGLFLILPEQANGKFGELSASHPGFVLAVWSPAFAAFAIIAWCSGLRGLRTFLSRLLLWRCPAAWYAYLNRVHLNPDQSLRSQLWHRTTAESANRLLLV